LSDPSNTIEEQINAFERIKEILVLNKITCSSVGFDMKNGCQMSQQSLGNLSVEEIYETELRINSQIQFQEMCLCYLLFIKVKQMKIEKYSLEEIQSHKLASARLQSKGDATKSSLLGNANKMIQIGHLISIITENKRMSKEISKDEILIPNISRTLTLKLIPLLTHLYDKQMHMKNLNYLFQIE
jgi:hypothetical protein